MNAPLDTAETPAAPPPAGALKPVKPPRHMLPLSVAIWFWGHVRKIVVFVIGVTLLGIGIALLVLPGPGWLVIFGGLALLATEFAWARWTLKHAQHRFTLLVNAAMRRNHRRADAAADGRAGSPLPEPAQDP